MNSLGGPVYENTAKKDFKLTYMESRALHPVDQLIVNGEEFLIKPGLQVSISKDSVY